MQRAIDGGSDSRAWVIEHFTPVLLVHARYRLSGPLRSFCDPEDLVQEVWAAALPRLPGLVARNGRWTPVLVKFMSTILLHKASKIARSYAMGQRPRREGSVAQGAGSIAGMDRFAGELTPVPGQAEANEKRQLLYQCIEALEPLDREILVLRGIEQIPNQRVAAKLGEQPSTVSMRYRRALGRLRQAFPESAFAELSERESAENQESR